jgi:hypothetical protein
VPGREGEEDKVNTEGRGEGKRGTTIRGTDREKTMLESGRTEADQAERVGPAEFEREGSSFGRSARVFTRQLLRFSFLSSPRPLSHGFCRRPKKVHHIQLGHPDRHAGRKQHSA